MARKVLIGVLSNRVPSFGQNWEDIGQSYHKGLMGGKTSFTTIACVQKMRSMNSIPDEVILVTSNTAKEKCLQRFNYELIENGFNKEALTVDITDSYSEELSWKLYNRLYEKLNDDDEIYLDITGGKRPVSEIIIEVVNYVKRIKHGIVVKELYYGDYEVIRKQPHKQEESKPKGPVNQEIKVEFYEIGEFMDLTEWAIGVQNYIQYADASYLKTIVNSNDYYKNSSAKKLVEDLDLFSNYLKVCQWESAKNLYYDSISENMDIFFKELKQKNELEKNRFKDLEALLKQKFEVYERNPYRGSVEWCENHGNYQQSLTLLNEFFKMKLKEFGYIEDVDDSEGLKNINETMIPKYWEFEKKDGNYELVLYSDLENHFYKKAKKLIDNVKTIKKDSSIEEIKKFILDIKKNGQVYDGIKEMYNNYTFKEEFETFEWFCSFIIQDELDSIDKTLTKKVRRALRASEEALNTFNKEYDITDDLRTDMESFFSTKSKEIQLNNEVIDTFVEYRKMLDFKEEVNEIVEESKSRYSIIDKDDLKNQKNSKEKKKSVPFSEEIYKTIVKQKFVDNKEELFNLILDWNLIREYRNFMDHAQMKEEYKSFDYISIKDTKGFKQSIEHLLKFIENN